METIYSNRRDGTVDHKIFWGPIDAEFEGEMRELVSVQNSIKREYVLNKTPIPEEPASDRLFLKVEKFLDEMYSRNEKYPVEMFLYSLKRTPGLMPDRGPGLWPLQQQRDIERYYISLLSTRINREVELSEDPEQEMSVQGLSHVLQHWPRYGAWKKALFVAISVAGRINMELPSLDKMIAEFLSDEVLWECAYFALTTRKQNRYSLKRLLLLLTFMTEAGNSNGLVKNAIFGRAIGRFTKLVDDLEQGNRDVYEELYLKAALDENNGKLPTKLKRVFHLDAQKPEGLDEAQDKEAYLREHFSTNYDGWISWQKWIVQLEDERLFRVLGDIYETSIYPNSIAYDAQMKVLFAFAKMKNNTLGPAYLHEVNSETFRLKSRGQTEDFIRKAALYLADKSYGANTLLAIFEDLPEYERRNVYPATRELCADQNYKTQVQNRIKALTEELEQPGVNTVDRLKLIDSYISSLPKWLKGSLVDHKLLAEKLLQICGYDPERDALVTPYLPFRTLNAVIDLVHDAITRDCREEYRVLLYSLLATSSRETVSALMQEMWSGEE